MFKAPACEALQTKLRFKSFCPRRECVCGGRGAGGGGSEANRAASSTCNYTAAGFSPRPAAGAWAACQTGIQRWDQSGGEARGLFKGRKVSHWDLGETPPGHTPACPIIPSHESRPQKRP